jgi:hypothetical protein
MRNIRNYTLTLLMVVAGALIAIFIYTRYFEKPQIVTYKILSKCDMPVCLYRQREICPI